MPLTKFFNPSSIAVIGASRTPGHIGNVILQNLTNGSYRGRLYPVNPNTDEILGIKCFPSVTKINKKVELAVIAVPAQSVIQVIKDCVKKHIKNVIIISAGFAEVGNIRLQNELIKIIKPHNIRVLGPNCLGIIDTRSGIDTVFIPQTRIRRPEIGNLAIVSQSGALGSTLLDIARMENIGISAFVSYGNAADIDLPELIEYFTQHRPTKAICIYVEGIKDGKAFLAAAKKATKTKPVIILKGGTTKAGTKAAFSHTASLAGDAEIYAGAFAQAGCIQAKSFEEFVDLAEIFSKAPKAKGSRIGIITNSGGHAILASDAIDHHGIPFAQLSEETISVLKKAISPVPINNPLDLLGDATAARYEAALHEFLADENVDLILLMCMPQTPLIDLGDMVKLLKRTPQKKPIICVTSGSTFAEQFKAAAELAGFPCYHYPEEAVRAIAKFVAYTSIKTNFHLYTQLHD